jgi:acetoin utilization protein AcuB
MIAKEIMTKDVFSVDQDRDFNHVELVAELKNIRHVPVIDGEQRVVGIVSIRDLLAHLTVAGASHFIPIKEVMHKQVITVDADTPVAEVAKILVDKNIGCVPVLENGKLAGVISERDFVRLSL